MKDPFRSAARGGEGALSLSDSLSLLRRVIAAGSSESVLHLVATTVNALTSHQDIDGCELRVGTNETDATGHFEPAEEVRRSSNISPALESWLRVDVTPVVMRAGEVHRESSLQLRGDGVSGCVLAVPIKDKTSTLGCLAVWNINAHAFLPWHETLLEMVAQILALALRPMSAPHRMSAGRTVSGEAPLRSDPHGRVPPPTQDLTLTTDSLTGLPDRRAFELSLHTLYALPVLDRSCRFILYLDIDRFRLIRDYGGHRTADLVVRTLAEVLKREFDSEPALARLGIDDFAVVVERPALEQAVALADALIDQVDAFRMKFAGQRYDISISIGVAELQSTSESGPAALRRAMRACRAAKSLGGGALEVYHPRLDKPRDPGNDGWMLNQLTRALKSEGLKLYAQSILPMQAAQALENTYPRMHEILLRLHDEQGQVRSAGTFLPLAERYGLSVKLDRWVIQAAFRQIAGSSLASENRHRFTLNLSGHSIDNHQLLEFILEQFESSGLSPQRICFEITETAAISDIAAAKEFVEALGAVGCQFALDDFGSGHASFLYLRDLPVDYLKIDGELVRKIVDDPVSRSLVATIHGLAQLMGKHTVAESVENQEISDAIQAIGCDYAQGYWIGSPLPLEDVLSNPPEDGSPAS